MFSAFSDPATFRLALQTTPSHVSISPNQNGTTAGNGLLIRKNVLAKKVIVNGVALCARAKECPFWSPRRDERSGVPIGAGGMWRSDWSERVLAVRVRARDQ